MTALFITKVKRPYGICTPTCQFSIEMVEREQQLKHGDVIV